MEMVKIATGFAMILAACENGAAYQLSEGYGSVGEREVFFSKEEHALLSGVRRFTLG